jgi:peptidylprolyl isomerase
MAAAVIGDTVRVHYSGRFTDGTEFDSSQDGQPLEFTIGSGQIVPGFEEAVVGMQPGESKFASIPPEKAYGVYRDELTVEVKRSDLPPGLDPEVGQRLQLENRDGKLLVVLVTDVNQASVRLDANHPLAGKDLVFEISLVEITQAGDR